MTNTLPILSHSIGDDGAWRVGGLEPRGAGRLHPADNLATESRDVTKAVKKFLTERTLFHMS